MDATPTDAVLNDVRGEVFTQTVAALPAWRSLALADVDFDAPKGFSSFTMGVRPRVAVDPPAVLYRRLGGKENAVLDGATERAVFALLGEHRIAAHCFHDDGEYRIEEFYRGRTLTSDEVFDPSVQAGIAGELHRFHRLEPSGLPSATFFELVHEKWSPRARTVLTRHREEFPPDEAALCDELLELCSDATAAKVARCLPDRVPVFTHNDTYHGNVMRLDDGRIRLLDFEFSCRNHAAFDFANLFAETVMRHGLDEPPHFDIAEPEFTDDDLAAFIAAYVALESFTGPDRQQAEVDRLLAETRLALLLPDYMYAMAAVTLARQPVQRLRFVPYAHRRFRKFLAAWDATFAAGA